MANGVPIVGQTFGRDVAAQLAGGAGGNPLAPLQSIAQTMSTLNQVRNQNAQYNARQDLGQIWATSPDPETAMARMQQSPNIGFAPEVLTQARESAMMLSQQRRIEQQIGVSGLQSLWQTVMPQVIADPTPQTFQNAARQWAATQPDGPEKTRTMGAFDTIQHSLLDGLPTDNPTLARQMFNQKAAGFLMASGMSQDHISAMTGQPVTIRTPGGDILGWRAGLFGGPGGVPPGGVTQQQTVSPGMAPSWQTVAGIPQAVPGVAPTVSTPSAPATTTPPPGASPGAGAVPVTREELPAQGTAPAASPGGAMPLGPVGDTSTQAPPPTTQVPKNDAGLPTPPATGALPHVDVPTDAIRKLGYVQAGQQEAQAHYKELSDRSDALRGLLQGIQEMRTALASVTTGPQQEWREPLSRLAAKWGAPQNIVDTIAGGGPGAFAAAQELKKLFVTTAMGQVRGQLPSGSRLNLSEWTAFQHNNPNLTTDPNAIEHIFNFWERQFAFNNAEVSQYSDYLRNGGDPMAWNGEWNRRAAAQGYIDVRQTTGGARGTTPGGGQPAPTARWNPQTQQLEPVR